MDRCERCGGNLLGDEGELKCFACGRTGANEVLGIMSAEEAIKDVELFVKADWDEYVAGRRETASERYGKSTVESRAEYNRVYYLAHREKSLASVLRWNKRNKSRIREYHRERKMFIDFGVCLVCGLPIHFNKECRWTHYRKDRVFHFAELG